MCLCVCVFVCLLDCLFVCLFICLLACLFCLLLRDTCLKPPYMESLPKLGNIGVTVGFVLLTKASRPFCPVFVCFFSFLPPVGSQCPKSLITGQVSYIDRSLKLHMQGYGYVSSRAGPLPSRLVPPSTFYFEQPSTHHCLCNTEHLILDLLPPGTNSGSQNWLVWISQPLALLLFPSTNKGSHKQILVSIDGVSIIS